MWDAIDVPLVETVKRAIETELSPNSSHEDRKSAHELIEAVKNDSPHSASIGLTLYADFENRSEFRYIGLQLVEEYIKKRWNALSNKEKDTWKKEVIFLLKAVRMSEVNHIKEALARVTVEIAKREFPQKWGTFLQELGISHTEGSAQLEVTLIVLLRLGEDVFIPLDSHIQTQRKKSIEQGLNEKMNDVFSFFIKALQENVGAWRRSHEQINLRLAEATLFALSVYLDHAAFEHVFANDSILLQMICELLNEEKLRMAAADCLLVVTERKRDRIDVRSLILVLFSDDAMNLFVEVARMACIAGDNEDEYNFLKKICDIIVSLGSCQLADIWGNDRGIRERPKSFERYMKLLLDMVNHPSQLVCLKALGAFMAFLKHDIISKDEVFVNSIPFFVSGFGTKLPKFGDIKDDNHPSCKYSVIDHDSSNEFLDCFSKLRSTLCTCIRDCTNILPVHCFEHICRMIMELVQKKEGQQDTILWDAMAVFTEAVLSRFWKSEMVDIPSNVLIELGKTIDVVAMSNEVLRSLVSLEVQIPPVTSHVLTCIQAFFPFFKKSQVNLIAALEKIMITFSQFPLKESNKEILSTRRHATVCFMRLCTRDSLHLLPYFDSFKQFVSKHEESKEITASEYLTLLEGLLILNNSMPANREDFILALLSRIDNIISKRIFIKSLESAEDFINSLGLGETNWNDPQPPEYRNDLFLFLGILAAIIRRVELTDSEKQSSLSSGGGSPYSYWIQKLIGYIPTLIQLIKHLGWIWTEETQAKINKTFISALRLNDNDRAFLLGQHVPKDVKETLDCSYVISNRASGYLQNLHSQSYSLLGNFGGFLGEIFYNIDGLAQYLISDVMPSWAFLPKYKLAVVFKSFFRSFLSSCPTNCFTIIVAPVLSLVLESMFKLDKVHKRFQHFTSQKVKGRGILSKEWEEFNERITKSVNKGQFQPKNDNPSDQVIEERLIYNLSRDYLETLVSFFFVKNKEKDAPLSEEETSNPDPGDLGNFILQCETTNTWYIFTLFNALTWPDTVAVHKIARVIPFIINFISQQTLDCKIDSSIIDKLFCCILNGLQVHGAEISAQGSLITLALNMYIGLRVSYPSLVKVMLMVPSCKKEKLKKFDLDVFEAECILTEKKKRECFKAFLSDAFGKNLSETYKADIKIKDLPPLAPRKKPKPPSDKNISDLSGLFDS